MAKIDRKIVNEPTYKNEPHYALIVFGLQMQHRSWLVMDGDDILYVDRNGNGDLTDPEDRIERDKTANPTKVTSADEAYLGMNTFSIGSIAGVKLQFMYWVRNKSAIPKEEFLRKALSEREMNNWENGTLWRITEDAGQAQNPIVLAATPAAAQITHLDGPLTFRLKWAERQRLQEWPKATVFDINIGTPAFPSQNCMHQIFSPLTEKEFPRDVHPIAVFQFPPVKPGDPPIVQEIELDERCCGDTAYVRFTVPEKVGPGKVKVTLTYPGWKIRDVQPATFEIPIGPDAKSQFDEVSYIFFDDPESKIGLNELMTALRAERFNCQKSPPGDGLQFLRIQLDDRRQFVVMLNHGAKIQDVARALAAGKPFEKQLSGAQSRVEISIMPPLLVVDEKELVSRLHRAIQTVTHGVLYTTWDKQLSAE